ncbi:MAG: hypothetical protein UY09_C0034G0002 [Parcubacteria group bacterium GW2011_GWA2_47_8]|nr:MAG: hypothetical protein UY09_C0034G0002 [Parcubacteria group bacterium GW2011_GWA2_47_8]OHB19928.1 MAG: hypothetical protein A2666_03125 [Parcubacteria group bacterium RIFCSPHIGHO2_01_FULL_47_10b]
MDDKPINRNVLVNGPGTVGRNVVDALLIAKKERIFPIGNVFVYKHTFRKREVPSLRDIERGGGSFVVKDCKTAEQFVSHGVSPSFVSLESAIKECGIIIDCTDDGIPTNTRAECYNKFDDGTRHFGCQGSKQDRAFGDTIAIGINESVLNQTQWLQALNCNGHASSTVINALCFDQVGLNLQHGHLVIQGRDSELRKGKGSGDRVGGFTAKEHNDAQNGTHQAGSIARLYKSIGIDLSLSASATAAPSPYMHLTCARFELCRQVTREWVLGRLMSAPLITTTEYMSANENYAVLKDRAVRLNLPLSVVIVPLSTVWVAPGNMAIQLEYFTPQEHNVVLTSLAIVAWHLRDVRPDEYNYDSMVESAIQRFLVKQI